MCSYLLATVTCAIEPESSRARGWHWYNEINIQNKKEQEMQEEINPQAKTAIKAMEQLRTTVQEAKARAILDPTVENIRTYLVLQNLVVGKAAMFTKMWKKTLLTYPELDYTLLHPTQNAAQQVMYSELRNKEDAAIKLFSKKYGMFFFYRGNNQLDQTLAQTIAAFSKEHSIALVPIAIDGKHLEIFGASQLNQGQAEKLGIKYFPALVLVEPKSQKIVPLNYGFISEMDLRRRFLQVASNFQEGI